MTPPDPIDVSKPDTETKGSQLRRALYRFRILIGIELVVGAAEVGLSLFGLGDVILGAVLLVAVLIMYGFARLAGRLVANRSWTIRFGMRHLMLFVLLAAVMFQLCRAFGWSILILAGLMTPPVVGVAIYVLKGDRRGTQKAGLVSVLALAARRGMPLGAAAGAYAGLLRGPYRWLVEELASRLDRGLALPAALDEVPGVLPRDATALARVGWASGTLPAALDEAASPGLTGKTSAPSWQEVFGYPLIVLAFILASGAFLTSFVGPRIKAIGADFQLNPFPEPAQTAYTLMSRFGGFISASHWFFGVTGSLVFGAFLTLLFVGLLLGIRLVFHLLMGFLDTASSVVTGGRSSTRLWPPLDLRRDGATVLRALSVGLEGGRPLPDILADLRGRGLGSRTRRRIASVASDVARGRDWISSLRGRGLIRPADALVLETAMQAGNLTWALRERADAIERRLNYRLQAWAKVLRPLSMLALGLLALLFCLFYFQPLVAMISVMTEDVS